MQFFETCSLRRIHERNLPTQVREKYMICAALLAPAGRVLALCLLIVSSWSCSQSNEDQLAQHVNRGDLYVQQGKFPEAVIEYRNAARGVAE